MVNPDRTLIDSNAEEAVADNRVISNVVMMGIG